MKRVLVVNDDGFRSAGLITLARRLSRTYDVTVVAPSSERSWIGKAVSAHTDLTVRRIAYGGITAHVVNGTPADCVQLGVYGVMEKPPEFVVSGINIGDNVGRARALSSGTIGAAMEGAIAGIPSIAASLCGTRDRGIDYFSQAATRHFEAAAEVVTRIVAAIEARPLPTEVGLISINLPFEATADSEVEVVTPSSRGYGSLFRLSGETWRHSGAPVEYDDVGAGTDLNAIANGRIAFCPIDMRLTDQRGLQYLQAVMSDWSSATEQLRVEKSA